MKNSRKEKLKKKQIKRLEWVLFKFRTMIKPVKAENLPYRSPGWNDDYE